jgi:HAE1 family hydrophobic/amphiphilic exporter-1
VAVLVSLLVSFTLTPMMSSRLLKRVKGHDGDSHAKSRGGLYGVIDRTYASMLAFCIRFRFPVAIVALLVIASSLPAYKLVKQEFVPGDVDEAEFEVRVNAIEGTSFGAMNAIMKEVEADLLANPAVRVVQAQAGAGFIGGTNQGQMYVRIAPHEERYLSFGKFWRSLRAGNPLDAFKGNYTQRDVVVQLRKQMERYRGRNIVVAVRNYPSINLGGGNFEIDFAIKGPDLQALSDYTEALKNRAVEDNKRGEGLLAGIADADTTLKLNKPELRVNIDRERAADLGVSPSDIGTALRLMVGGDEEVTRFHDLQTNEDYDVQLRLTESDRTDDTVLPRLLLPRRASAGGALANANNVMSPNLVELRNIASLESSTTPSRIDRTDRARSANVRAAVGPGFALQDRLDALRQAAAELNLPRRTQRRSPAAAASWSALLAVRGAFLLSIIFMYMILARSTRACRTR